MKKIGIDPGHGGHDPGAIGPGGTYEKDLTLPVALKLADLLKANGFKTVLTRQTDQYVSLNERTGILNNTNCDLAISIHCNGSGMPEPDYVSTFIVARGGKAETLAIFVQRHLVKATGWEDGGVRVGNFHMVRETDMPAVLPELGFITNPKQEQWLKEPENQYKLAKAIARGICDYYAMEFKEPKGEDNNMFKDVMKDRWSYRDIMAMAKLKILQGYPDGTFKPEQPVTREELAAALNRMFGMTNEDFVEIIDTILPKVVQIENDGHGLGSGVLIHPDGYIITNCHVVSNNFAEWQEAQAEDKDLELEFPSMVGMRSEFNVFEGANYAMGPVLYYDEYKDLAVVKPQLGESNYKYPAMEIVKENPGRAEKVIAIGSPLGLIGSVAEGVISAVRKSRERTLLQTEAEINPGNSGGALVNLKGQLVGVNVQKYIGIAVEGLNFAVSAETVRKFIQEGIDAGKLPDKLKTIL